MTFLETPLVKKPAAHRNLKGPDFDLKSKRERDKRAIKPGEKTRIIGQVLDEREDEEGRVG